jgi:hypothetical protein
MPLACDFSSLRRIELDHAVVVHPAVVEHIRLQAFVPA